MSLFKNLSYNLWLLFRPIIFIGGAFLLSTMVYLLCNPGFSPVIKGEEDWQTKTGSDANKDTGWSQIPGQDENAKNPLQMKVLRRTGDQPLVFEYRMLVRRKNFIGKEDDSKSLYNFPSHENFAPLMIVALASGTAEKETLSYFLDDSDKYTGGVLLEKLIINPFVITKANNVVAAGSDVNLQRQKMQPQPISWLQLLGSGLEPKDSCLLRIERFGYFDVLRAVERPTSVESLVSFLKDKWQQAAGSMNEDYAKDPNLMISKEEMKTIVAPALEQWLKRDLKKLTESNSLTILTIANGYIQLLILVAFFSGLFWCGVELWLLSSTKYNLKWLLTKQNQAVNRRAEKRLLWLRKSIFAPVAEDGICNETRYDRFVDAKEDFLSREGFSIRFFFETIPALGFVGTVWGISNALPQASKMLSDVLAVQQAGMNYIVSLLGTSFHTTMVALIFGIFSSMVLLSLRAFKRLQMARIELVMIEYSKPPVEN